MITKCADMLESNMVIDVNRSAQGISSNSVELLFSVKFILSVMQIGVCV